MFPGLAALARRPDKARRAVRRAPAAGQAFTRFVLGSTAARGSEDARAPGSSLEPHVLQSAATYDRTPVTCDNPQDVAASSESEVIAQQLSTLGARITRLEARLAEVDPVIARLEVAALTTARSMQEISQHWDAVYEAMRRDEQQNEVSSRADARRPPPDEPHESSTDDAS